jgi:dissimilatory sulfite reductase (desulfoviridin) alpha/beta subunit
MGFAKERGKLEKLATKVKGLIIYDEKSLTVITDIFEQYSHSVRILKNKHPEAFMSLYENDLEQVKAVKKALKESEEADRQDSFVKYRDALAVALNSAITATKEAA